MNGFAFFGGLLPELNLTKAVKVVLYDDFYVYQAEMYLINAENFKHVFYKLMYQLDALESETAEKCTTTTNSVLGYDTKLTMSNLFPVKGITIGEYTLKTAKNNGEVEEAEGWYYTRVGTTFDYLTFYDNDKDNIFEEVVLYRGYETPPHWKALGIDMDASWNEWISFLRNNGYEIVYDNNEVKVNSDGHKYLQGSITATSSATDLKVKLYFTYGGFDDVGYSLDSRRTLSFFSITKES